MTDAGQDPAYGRLDRILAAQATATGPEPNWEGRPNRSCGEHRTVGPHRALCYDCGGQWCYPGDPCPGCRSVLGVAEVDVLRAGMAALEAECAALADALDEDRHEFDGLDMEVVDRAGATRTATVCVSTAAESRCRRTADHRVHRTSAVVRAELEGQ